MLVSLLVEPTEDIVLVELRRSHFGPLEKFRRDIRVARVRHLPLLRCIVPLLQHADFGHLLREQAAGWSVRGNQLVVTTRPLNADRFAANVVQSAFFAGDQLRVDELLLVLEVSLLLREVFRRVHKDVLARGRS